MIHRSRKIGICKRDPAMSPVAQDVSRRGLAVRAEEKAGLRIDVGMAPAIENDARDVAPRVEAAWGEHVAELLAEDALVLRE